jgi:hypothetical protein
MAIDSANMTYMAKLTSSQWDKLIEKAASEQQENKTPLESVLDELYNDLRILRSK